MPNAYKTLGNGTPGPSLVTIYTCPSGSSTVAKLVVTNRSGTDRTFRFAVSPGGAAIQNSHYWFYDYDLPANDTVQLDGLALDEGDVCRAYGSTTDVTFNLNGVEIN